MFLDSAKLQLDLIFELESSRQLNFISISNFLTIIFYFLKEAHRKMTYALTEAACDQIFLANKIKVKSSVDPSKHRLERIIFLLSACCLQFLWEQMFEILVRPSVLQRDFHVLKAFHRVLLQYLCSNYSTRKIFFMS